MLGIADPYKAQGYNATGVNIDPNAFNIQGADQMQHGFQSGATGSQSQAGQIYGQQGTLNGMLMSQANGGGPNPALSQLHQTTDQNIANQFAMAQGMGGNQAGAARNAMNQAGALNQNAAGQAATMRATQQLGAEGQLGQQLGQQSAQANQMTQFYLGQGMNLAQAQQQAQAQMQGLNVQQNLGIQGMNEQNNAAIQGINAGAYQNQNQQASGILGGVLGGVSSVATMGLAHKARGGLIPGYDDGGQVAAIAAQDAATHAALAAPRSPQSQTVADAFQHSQAAAPDAQQASRASVAQQQTLSDAFRHYFAPQPQQVAMAQAPMSGAAMSHGGAMPWTVPGFATGGDSAKNDTVPAMLSPGEGVLPRSVMLAPDAPEKAKAFVAAIRAKKRKAA